jgi:hypothetical protein
MKIKIFDQLDEKLTDNEQKAIDDGYKVGERVFSIKLNKVITITDDAKVVMDDKDDNYCMLGAVGESPNWYKKLPNNSYHDRKFNLGKLNAEKNLKHTIDLIFRNSYFSKSELEKIISEFISIY